jgi:NADPH-dependent 2,4-dienoyl-CoA reductase/sulfur reductase-like enzyme
VVQARENGRCEDGETLVYDKLLIASGSRRPVAAHSGHPGRRRAHLLDAGRCPRHHAELAKPGARVLQMGAGFIGCIIMEALAARGVQLSVVEMGDRMVPRMMGPTAGGMIKRLVRGQGNVKSSPGRGSRPSSPVNLLEAG